MSEERWLLFEDAVAMIRARFDTSVGEAQVRLRAASASGQIRKQPRGTSSGNPLLFLSDNPLLDFGWRRPRPEWREDELEYSEDDLRYWLDQQRPESGKAKAKPRRRFRYPGDAVLVEEARELVAGGMAQYAAAKKLAPKADKDIGTIEQRVEHLRKIFAELID